MIYLQPNTANNPCYFTLKEKDKELGTVSNYLIVLTHAISEEKYYFIANVQEDNERYTKVFISTNSEDAENGSILLTETGQYYYDVYGQNSDTNLDPANAVGLFEVGICKVVSSLGTYFDVPTIVTDQDIIYYAG